MFDLLNQAMLYILGLFQSLTGSYGWAIIAITVLLRVVLWPMNTAQARSMKKMQALQPKLKQIQERYKGDPQKLMQEQMRLYQESQFNPMMGCLPLLIQLPIIFSLYGALISPEFQVRSGSESFLFIQKLHNTMYSYAGEPMDGTFDVHPDDKFATARHVTLQLDNGKTLERPVRDPNHSLVSAPHPLIPGEPVNFYISLASLQLPDTYRTRIVSATVPVMNNGTREMEPLTLKPMRTQPWLISTPVPTVEGKLVFHPDAMVLTALFILLSLMYQRVMTASQPAATDPAQATMMKLMPAMIVIPFLLFPIPSGVMLYLVVSTGLMFFQTWYVNRQEDAKASGTAVSRPSRGSVIDVKPDRA